MIQKSTKSILIFTLQMMVIWILALLFLQFLRSYGISESPIVTVTEERETSKLVVLTLIMGAVIGIVYAASELLFQRAFFQRIPLGRLMIVKTILYFILVKLLFLFAIFFLSWGDLENLQRETVIGVMHGKIYWVVLTYVLVVSFAITFVREISQKFGPGILWKFIIGKYNKPQEEDRIFLFIDMQSSTAIAEKLGHLNFSMLIQDCFFDLTAVIAKNKVDIYQYVGDEAVLCWEKKSGIKDLRCIHSYFEFMEILNGKSKYYTEKYGVTPFFKAGLHAGIVTVAEVGVIKKDIAYHGDVLNTTARIQGECNKYNQALLASESILSEMDLEGVFTKKYLGAPELKGKEKRINMFGVQPI